MKVRVAVENQPEDRRVRQWQQPCRCDAHCHLLVVLVVDMESSARLLNPLFSRRDESR